MGMGIKDIVLIEEILQETNGGGCLLKISDINDDAAYRVANLEDEYKALFETNKSSSFSILELGNQRLKPYKPVSLKKDPNPRPPSAKGYFSKIGISHTSIDKNGCDGSMPLDLTTNLQDVIKERYSLVTNFGTSEHVKKQYPCWKNIHDLCKKGGHFIHTLPPVGFWERHPNCFYWYTEEFLEKLAELNDYKIKKLYRRGIGRKYPKITCVMEKNKLNEFISKEEYDKISVPPFLYRKHDGSK
jgi:hypothetical protein